MVRIVWTELSVEDLKGIFEYISEDSVRYANITVKKIYQRTQVINNNLYIGRVVPELNEKLVREIIADNYRIIYRIKSDIQVDILRVFHTSRILKRNKLQ